MKRRRSAASIVANPILVGAVTTLVVLVAVFLAYNANNGLPFVPTHDYAIEFPNGANLVRGDEVRQGGYRVGVVSDMNPVSLPGGKVGAEVKVKLDEKTGRLPVDSKFAIRPRSVLGLKYVELDRGTSRQLAPEGHTFTIASTSTPVELDQVFNMFDPPTRAGSRRNLKGFGDAFAARGESLNAAIGRLPRFLGYLAPVAANLAAPVTQLDQFFLQLGRTAAVIAPIAEIQSRLFTDLATTFEAISRSPKDLQDTIAKSPGTLAVGTRSFAVQRPFLRHFASLSRDLRSAAAELPSTLPVINDALEVGAPVVRKSVELNDELHGALSALDSLVRDPLTLIALRATTATVGTLNPELRFLGPYVTVCNYWNYWWTFVAEHFSERDGTGSAQRALLNSADRQTNGVGAAGATAPANGPLQYLHGQPYGSAVTSQGMADCEAGQRGYTYKANAIGDQKYLVSVDPHTPGAQGSTYQYFENGKGIGRGPDRVPPGETFSREPEFGPQLDPRVLGGE